MQGRVGARAARRASAAPPPERWRSVPSARRSAGAKRVERESAGETQALCQRADECSLCSHTVVPWPRTGIVMSVRGTPSRGGLGGSSLAGLRGRTAGAGRSSAADSRTYEKHGELAHRERHVCADHWHAVWLPLWGVTRRQWGSQLGGCRVEPSRFGIHVRGSLRRGSTNT